MTAQTGCARTTSQLALACLLALALGSLQAAPNTGPKTLNLDTLDLNGGVFGPFHLKRPPISLDTHRPTTAAKLPMSRLGAMKPLDDPQRFAGAPAGQKTGWELDLEQWMESARTRLLTVPDTGL